MPLQYNRVDLASELWHELTELSVETNSLLYPCARPWSIQ
jgi:hypothetical protein